jgi:hypothetical protein
MIARYISAVEVGKKLSHLGFEKIKKDSVYCYPVRLKN